MDRGDDTYPFVCVNRRSAVLDVTRDIPCISAPEPDLDEVVRAFHGVPAAACAVKCRPIAVRRRRLHATSGVVRCGNITIIAGGGPVGCCDAHEWRRRSSGIAAL